MKNMKPESTGSAKRLNRNGCTSSRVSGPPRFNNRTPIFPSSLTSDVDISRVLEVSTARNGNEYLVSGCLRDIDCFPDQQEYLGGKDVLEELRLLAEESIWITEQ